MTDDNAESVQATAEAATGTSAAVENGANVRFEVGGKVIDIALVNRMARRLLEGQASKYSKKYADAVGPNGEKPTVVLRMPRLMDPKVQVVLEYPESMAGSVKGHEKAVRVS